MEQVANKKNEKARAYRHRGWRKRGPKVNLDGEGPSWHGRASCCPATACCSQLWIAAAWPRLARGGCCGSAEAASDRGWRWSSSDGTVELWLPYNGENSGTKADRQTRTAARSPEGRKSGALGFGRSPVIQRRCGDVDIGCCYRAWAWMNGLWQSSRVTACCRVRRGGVVGVAWAPPDVVVRWLEASSS